MKGHIRERSPGRWAIIIDVPDTGSGKRKRRWHSFAGTKRQAQVECARLISEQKSGIHVDPTRVTVGEFFDRWLDHMVGQCLASTHERYCELSRKNLVPLLGGSPISQTAAGDNLAGLRQGAHQRAPRRAGRAVPANCSSHASRAAPVLSNRPWSGRLLARNPADMVKPPKVERKQMKTLDADGTVELIEAARGDKLFIPILLGVLCGLRRGEVAALRWRSVDLNRGQLAVIASTEQTNGGIREKETKSGKSRAVALPAMIIEELRLHRLRQAEQLLALGVRLDDDLHVVAREDGQPLQPRSLSQAFRKFIARHGLKKIRLHDLRHAPCDAHVSGRRASEDRARAARAFERERHNRPLLAYSARNAG